MDVTGPVLKDLAARIGQLTVQLALATAERDAVAEQLKQLREEAADDCHGDLAAGQ